MIPPWSDGMEVKGLQKAKCIHLVLAFCVFYIFFKFTTLITRVFLDGSPCSYSYSPRYCHLLGSLQYFGKSTWFNATQIIPIIYFSFWPYTCCAVYMWSPFSIRQNFSFFHLLFEYWWLVLGGSPSHHQITGTSECPGPVTSLWRVDAGGVHTNVICRFGQILPL